MGVLSVLMAGLAAGTLATFAVRGFALRFGIVSQPNPIVVQHTRPVAYLGGVGIWVGAVAVLMVFGGADAAAGTGFFVPATLFLALGVSDDLWEYSPAYKFVAQLAVAAVAAILNPDIAPTGFAWLDGGLLVLWIVVLVNAFNLIDVCDGLAGGVAVIALLFLWALDPAGSVLPVAIAAATLGFLVWNAPPASIFMGDAGSHLLGFTAALVAARLFADQPAATTGLQVLLVLGVPLFEVVLLITARVRKGLPWWRGSPDHFSLRLQAAGLGKWPTILTGFAVALVLGAAAMALETASPVATAGIVLAVLTGLAGCLYAVLRLPGDAP